MIAVAHRPSIAHGGAGVPLGRRTLRFRLLLLASLLSGLACTAAPLVRTEEAQAPRGDSRTLTVTDLSSAVQLDLLGVVTAQRPQWLRGIDGRPAAILVYLGETLLGDGSTLRDISVQDVSLVRYFDPIAAQQRFRVHSLSPVIQVSLR